MANIVDYQENCWPALRVATWLGFKNAEQFQRNRTTLEKECGFPAPLPGVKRLIWSPVQLKAWVASLIPENQRKALSQISSTSQSSNNPLLNIKTNNDWAEELQNRLVD